MIKCKLSVAVAFLLLESFSSPALGDGIAKGKLGVGLNSPGFGVRYFISNKISIEARGQLEKNAFAAGPRVCYYFGALSSVYPYVGLDADYLHVNGNTGESSGISGDVFVGGEYFIFKQLSLQFDFGPAYLSLKDTKWDVSVSGIEYVINFGITYYFGK